MTTVQDLIASPKPDISPAEAAAALGYKTGYGFNVAARLNRDIGFRYFWRGRNLRISKADVLRFLGYEQTEGGWIKHGDER